MANCPSTRKSIRKTKSRTERNRAVKSRLRTFRRKTLELIESGDKEKAEEAYREYASAADKAAKKNVIHRNAANRLKSRMATRLSGAAS